MKVNHSVSIKTLTIVSITFMASALYSQQNAIRMTPLQPVIGKFSIDYERVIHPGTTCMVEYQSWFEHRSSGAGLWLLGIPAAAWDESSNKGFRVSVFLRKYRHEAMRGGFLEGGAYIGRHDITTRSETVVLFPDPDFPFNFWHSNVESKHYDHVRSFGLRCGGGWHKVKGRFSLEFSGGFNLNGNSQGVRPTLGMKPVAPYTRFALGVAF